MIGAILGWIIFSIVIGALGSKRKIGFAGAFFLSLILSPLIGLIITLTSKLIETEKYETEILETQKKQLKMLENISQHNVSYIADDLKKIKELVDSGVINHEEFNKMKNRLIYAMDKSSTLAIKQSEIKSDDINDNKDISNKEFEKTWITYSVNEGKLEIEIYKINKFPWSGDSVKINGEPAPDGEYKIGLLNVIKVKDSKIYK
ncbi:MAG: SHOCT domain-containing protein [Candidatus Izemoplasmatales bacterium]|jgi:hypothetical protein|nr:SHOCT domain-containing protein [Bacteroidales bacterium]MDY0317776.1 SHOCT domain-containing protein [Candidatus Izemoplasmatales bacterium]